MWEGRHTAQAQILVGARPFLRNGILRRAWPHVDLPLVMRLHTFRRCHDGDSYSDSGSHSHSGSHSDSLAKISCSSSCLE